MILLLKKKTEGNLKDLCVQEQQLAASWLLLVHRIKLYSSKAVNCLHLLVGMDIKVGVASNNLHACFTHLYSETLLSEPCIHSWLVFL